MLCLSQRHSLSHAPFSTCSVMQAIGRTLFVFLEVERFCSSFRLHRAVALAAVMRTCLLDRHLLSPLPR